jgi:Flp pilus assembly protein TadG
VNRRGRGERGDAGPLEVVILVPVVLLVFGLVVAFSRTTTATEHVAHAAAVGARAAASAQTMSGASVLATDVVVDALAQVGMSCAVPAVAGTFRPGGSVTVTVSCTVDLGDVTDLGLIPGSRTLTATATEVIDRTRGGAG